jgi:hypothetical protein
LNSKGKGAGLHFYELVDLLFAESEFVQVEEAYIKQNQTTRHTQLGQKVLQHQLLYYGKIMIGTNTTIQPMHTLFFGDME